MNAWLLPLASFLLIGWIVIRDFGWRRVVCAITWHGEPRYHEDGLGAAWCTCPRCGKVTAAVTHHGGTPWLHEQQVKAVGKNGWTCMACGDYRPDHLISVITRHVLLEHLDAHVNVRYCNDRPLCRQRAASIAHARKKQIAS